MSIKFVVFLSLFFISTSVTGDELRMNYPDDFNDIPDAAYNSLSEVERLAYCIFWLEAEVNNGGFHQFFHNASGLRTPETLKALDTIGAQKTKALLRSASTVAYESGFPSDPTNHQELLRDDDAAFDSLNELDSRFYMYEDDLPALVNQFLKSSKEC